MRKKILVGGMFVGLLVAGLCRAGDFPYAQGEVIGPIEVSSSANYLLYIPKSLPDDRDVPLLFYTHSQGASRKLLDRITEAAEMTGWIFAMSVESSNKNSVESNCRASEDAVDHIRKKLPVDRKRLYFTGNSGGGAQSYYNADKMDACGVMPNVGYIPSGAGTPSVDCFIINGGKDYNRYVSARNRKKIGDTAIHRFHRKGHGVAPNWLMIEGVCWLEGRYLAETRKKVGDEKADYVAAMLEWIGSLKEAEPHRAYYWALFLQENLKLSSKDKSAAKTLIDELGQEKTNVLYVQGVKDLDLLSKEQLSNVSGQFYGKVDENVASACDTLLVTYAGVPLIEEALKALREPTKKPN
jgi:hypothetical protein